MKAASISNLNGHLIRKFATILTSLLLSFSFIEADTVLIEPISEAPVVFEVDSPPPRVYKGKGGDVSVEITSNTNWSVVTSDSWISVSQERGSGNGIVTITVTANPNGSLRSGHVTFRAGGITAKSKIVLQDPKHDIFNKSIHLAGGKAATNYSTEG